ncbi:MAG: sulfur dioxygenase [Gammaproteobacteria bacterium]|jgi:sulfur dioxygenase
MIFRQLFDGKSSTYTYLLADEMSCVAVLIDPVLEQVSRDLALVKELGLTLETTLDTHCHADHVTGAWLIKQKTNSQIACAAVINATNVDRALKHGDVITVGSYQIEVLATPGHTEGCLTYVCHAEKLVFTGDALLIRGCGRCDFQGGDAGKLYDSINQRIFSLPDDYALYPGHDYAGRCASSVAEEKQYNTRLGGQASKSDFVGFMNNMTLQHPRHIDVAVPANLKSGEIPNVPSAPDWAPVELTYAGIYEVTPNWVSHHIGKVTVLDVRETSETDGGKIVNSLLIPLSKLTSEINKIPNDKPIVTFCRSGRRSALAVSILNSAGFSEVANINGGFLKWQEEGLPLDKSQH